jgi:hypothetical protein
MKTNRIKSCLLFFLSVLVPLQYGFADIIAAHVKEDLSKASFKADLFARSTEETIMLIAQPMTVPRPKVTSTEKIKVRAIHNGKHIAFLLTWNDKNKNEAGKLGEYSDAVAIQFPVKDNTKPPPIFMGGKGDPVHIFHWRAQYQRDKEKGLRDIKDIYPNMFIDIYPMEFPNSPQFLKVDEAQREVYSFGRAAGNPQSYVKKGVDEIIAEGFSTSSVIENVEADAEGKWENNEWKVVITRPLKRENGSVLEDGKSSFVGFAVWQGSLDEVGSRKSVTMMWTSLKLIREVLN